MNMNSDDLRERRKQWFAPMEQKLKEMHTKEDDSLFYYHSSEDRIVLSHALFWTMTQPQFFKSKMRKEKFFLLLRQYVDYWTPEQMHVLDVRPGITDPASIKFRNENELMEKTEDPEKYYIEVIMQEKIKLYLEYVEKPASGMTLG